VDLKIGVKLAPVGAVVGLQIAVKDKRKNSNSDQLSVAQK